MKFAVVFAAIFAVAIALPVDNPSQAQILRYDNENIGVDGYNFQFETSDGTSRQESAQLKHLGPEEDALQVRGSFKYLGDDGVTYQVNYVADENGFQPEAAHLPVA